MDQENRVRGGERRPRREPRGAREPESHLQPRGARQSGLLLTGPLLAPSLWAGATRPVALETAAPAPPAARSPPAQATHPCHVATLPSLLAYTVMSRSWAPFPPENSTALETPAISQALTEHPTVGPAAQPPDRRAGRAWRVSPAWPPFLLPEPPERVWVTRERSVLPSREPRLCVRRLSASQ